MHRDAIMPSPAVLQASLEHSGPPGEERDVAVVESVPLSSDSHKKPADHSGWKGLGCDAQYSSGFSLSVL